MNRREFMDALEKQLSDVPVEDRIDILQYYEDYFEDAGYEKEQDIISELKSPENVAEIIKKDLGINASKHSDENVNRSQYKDYRKSYDNQNVNMKNNYTQSGYEQQNYQKSETEDGLKKAKRKLRNIDKRIWLVLLIFLVPISFSTIVGVIATLVGIVLGVIGLLIGAYIGGAGCIIAAIALLATQMFSMASLVFGIGLILIAIGLLVTILSKFIFRVVIPTVFNGIKKLCNYLFNDEEAVV